jgi:two-component system vancomycin resistance associated response regulator VraR
MAIRVLIVDDTSEALEQIQRILKQSPSIEVVGHACSRAEAVNLARGLKPDIVVMDVEMEEPDSGILAAREIHSNHPEIKIIILTVHNDEQTVLLSFQEGIVDFLNKEEAPSSLVEAVLLADRGKSPLRPIVAQHVRAELLEMRHREEQLLMTIQIISTLTATELSILRDVVAGKKRHHIARDRFVELVTVKKHINSIRKKFHGLDTNSIVKLIQEMRIFEVLDKMFPKV